MERHETGYTKYMTDDEWEAVRSWIIQNVHSPSCLMALFFIMYSGTPPVDTLQLRLKDFRGDFTQAHIIRQKTSRPYIIRIPNVLSKALESYVKHYKHRFTDEYLFFADFHCKNPNKHLQTSTLRKIIIKCRKDLKFNEIYYTCKNGKPLFRVSLYTLRHYVAERLYEASNHDIMFIKEYLNHSKLETTQEYLRGFKNNDYINAVLDNAWM